MIRYALAFLGLSAGAVSAQGIGSAAPFGVVEQVVQVVSVADVTPQVDETADTPEGPVAAVASDGATGVPVVPLTVAGGGPLADDFSVDEVAGFATVRHCGVVPFDLDALGQIRVDGSDPSADFCP